MNKNGWLDVKMEKPECKRDPEALGTTVGSGEFEMMPVTNFMSKVESNACGQIHVGDFLLSPPLLARREPQ
jgi:hypothetical protein